MNYEKWCFSVYIYKYSRDALPSAEKSDPVQPEPHWTKGGMLPYIHT